MFADNISAKFTSFEAYLQNMSMPSTWGPFNRQLACLLLTPIRVLSDSEVESERLSTPPPTIAPEVWGQDIVICHVGSNHFEATARLAESRADVKAEPKRIKVER